MQPREEWSLAGERLGRRVLVFDSLDSTNTYAASLADDPANDGLVVIADEQTAGRGQHGRSWHSPAGTSLLLSILLFPPPVLRRPVILAAWTAVSVCETIQSLTGLQAKIKWPNDVLIHGRKVCGILIEQARGTVAGLGLNINQDAAFFKSANLPAATSLSIEAGKVLERPVVARRLIHQLDQEYCRLCQGDLSTLEACWKWRTGLLGKNVQVECQGADHQGRLLDMGWNGLELHTEVGAKLRFLPENVKHVSAV